MTGKSFICGSMFAAFALLSPYAFGQAMTGADRAKADRAESDSRSKEGHEIRIKKSDQPVRPVAGPIEAVAAGAVGGAAAAARAGAGAVARQQALEKAKELAAEKKRKEDADARARSERATSGTPVPREKGSSSH